METFKLEELSDEKRNELSSFYKLCYVELSNTVYGSTGGKIEAFEYNLYFTTRDIKELSGDGWDDESWIMVENPAESCKKYDINGMRIEGNFIIITLRVAENNYLALPPTPTTLCDINSGACSWLYYPAKDKKANGIPIYAGMTPNDIWARIGHLSI